MVSDPEGTDTFASIHHRWPSPVIPETDPGRRSSGIGWRCLHEVPDSLAPAVSRGSVSGMTGMV